MSPSPDPFFKDESQEGLLADREKILGGVMDLILIGPEQTTMARLKSLSVLLKRDKRPRHVIAAELRISAERFEQHLAAMSKKTGISWRLKAPRRY